jgi:lysozyme family protein
VVGGPLGIPWYFIGCIHALESGFNFNTHLFNGDPLTSRTVRVPKGQPEAPPEDGEGYSWEESARAAMALKGYDRATNWSLPRLLHRWEAYNGFGYRRWGVPTPYLWSFSTLYSRGRYVADHTFDSNAVSKQAGAAAMLKTLVKDNTVTLPT